jgi:hypothetical protein
MTARLVVEQMVSTLLPGKKSVCAERGKKNVVERLVPTTCVKTWTLKAPPHIT